MGKVDYEIPSPRRGEDGRGAELARQNSRIYGKCAPTITLPLRGKELCKRAFFQLEVKALNAVDGTFAGYASVFNVVDSQCDIVRPGAFRETIAKRQTPLQLLWQHEWNMPVGIISKIFEDARGLYVEGQLLLDVAKAREAYALLKAGAVRGLSIGFTVEKSRRLSDAGVRELLAVNLWEISLVTMPANESANVTVVKQRAASEYAPLLSALGHANDALKGMAHSHLRYLEKKYAIKKYNPNQPRVPAGSSEGGQWASGGAGGVNAIKPTYDADKAIEVLQREAKPRPRGRCASHVRRAIQAGGLKLPWHPAAANKYDPYLSTQGFKKITPTPLPDYRPQKGDVAVFQAYPGGSKEGHIAMYDGTNWISDFRQHGFWPGTGYQIHKPPYAIYRYP